MIKIAISTTLFLVISSLSACATTKNVPFDVIKQSLHCHQADAGIVLLSDSSAQMNLAKQMTAFHADDDKKALYETMQKHANSDYVFVIKQGTKPTAGYGFDIQSNTGALLNDTLTLPISFKQPQKNTMQAQMMTSPCLIIGVEKNTTFKKLIVDQLIYDL